MSFIMSAPVIHTNRFNVHPTHLAIHKKRIQTFFKSQIHVVFLLCNKLKTRNHVILINRIWNLFNRCRSCFFG